MQYIARRGLQLLAVTLFVAVLGGLLAAPAMAATPRIVSTLSSATPVQGTNLTVDAKVLNNKGHAVANTKVTFVWTVDNKPFYKVTVTSDSHGLATVTKNILTPIPWRVDKIAITGLNGEQTVKKTVTFQPLPLISTGHPVYVRIGLAGPYSKGATALGNGAYRGAILAVGEFNASSTVQGLGITFNALKTDDQGNPAVAVKRAKTLIADPRLLGVEGHLNSGCSIAAAKVYASASVAMISPASTNPQLTQLKLNNVFRTCANDDSQGIKGANAVYSLGKRKVYIVDDSTAYGAGIATAFKHRFLALSGAKVLGTAKTKANQTKFAKLVATIKSKHPDIVYYGGIYNAGALFAKQLRNAGVSASLLGADGLFDPKFISIGGSAVSNDLCTSVGRPPTDLPDGAAFTTAFTTKYPSTAIGYYDAYAYDATKVILQAIVDEARIHGAERLGLGWNKTRILTHIHYTTTVGATGPISFTPKGDRIPQDIALYKVIASHWTYQTVY